MTDQLTWTTLTVMSREKGRVAMISRTETIVMRWAQTPGPSSHTERRVLQDKWIVKVLNKIIRNLWMCRRSMVYSPPGRLGWRRPS